MATLTFDNMAGPAELRTVADMMALGQGVPNRVEIGENGLVWYYALRRERRIEIVSKETGSVTAKVAIDECAGLVSECIRLAAVQALSLASNEDRQRRG